MKVCAAAVAAVSTRPQLLHAASAETVREYDRTLITHANGEPVVLDDISSDESYVFHYPYVTTPCFLLNLSEAVTGGAALRTAEGKRYTAPGGVGPRRSVVAFSAICAHKMSHPTRKVSFINYRADEATYNDLDDKRRKRSGIIFCCSERSVYDPAQGGDVLGGPAPQPLASIELEFDTQSGNLYATGTRGGEMFADYFDKFGFRLQLEHEITDVAATTGKATTLYKASEYCSTQIRC